MDGICVIHKRHTYKTPDSMVLQEKELVIQGNGIRECRRIMRAEWADWECKTKLKKTKSKRKK